MRKYAWLLTLAMAFIVFAGFIFLTLHMEESQNGRQTVPISMILYGEATSERWKPFDQGISQACAELGIEKPVLTLADPDDPDLQKKWIRRELDNGAQGLLVAANDSDALREFLEEVYLTTPVVMVETGVGDAVPLLAAQDEAMGRVLAEGLAGTDGTVAVLAENLQRDSVRRRFDAFLTYFDGTVVTWENPDPAVPTGSFIAASLAAEKPDALVVLDNDALELAIDSAPAAMVDVEIWGIGGSDKVVHALDSGGVTEICYSNEYAIGYLAMLELAHAMGLTKTAPAENDIQYRLVRRENMHEPEIERLLFPITQ